jgi:FtsP/CotA-like multicopper oxidase with cupredoxin domain
MKHQLVILLAALCFAQNALAATEIDDAADLSTQQAQEKQVLEEMRQEMNDITNTLNQGAQGLNLLQQKVQNSKAPREQYLIAKEANWEIMPGAALNALTYNGQIPGPVIRVKEGELVRITLQNQLKVPTSLSFHGMALTQGAAGLPRENQGLVPPGGSFVYQFFAERPGTFWYHPQVPHLDQLPKGMYGAVVVEPTRLPKTYERDFAIIFGECQAADKGASKQSAHFLTNGKTAAGATAIELKSGERIRLRMINASQSPIPLFLTGHRMEVISVNGSDSLEPHVMRDTLTLQPGDRVDAEVVANNPGVWSLASLIPSQNLNNGKFPGGIATVVRYCELR